LLACPALFEEKECTDKLAHCSPEVHVNTIRYASGLTVPPFYADAQPKRTFPMLKTPAARQSRLLSLLLLSNAIRSTVNAAQVTLMLSIFSIFQILHHYRAAVLEKLISRRDS
jgi:hypothetical protein